MTVSSVTEMWSRASSSEQTEDLKSVTVEYSSEYQVVHDPTTTLDQIKYAAGIPRLGDELSGRPFVYCKSVGPIKKGLTLSYVPVRWKGEGGLEGEEDPLLQAPEVEYRPLKSEAEIDEDASGVPITTTCGEPVSGITKNIADMVLRVKRNYLAFNGILALQYMDSVNSDVFDVLGNLWQPGQAAVTDFSVVPVFNKQRLVDYFKISCEVQLRVPYRTTAARAWFARYRNEGMYARFGTQVSFSGGGGSGAAAYAITNPSGAVTDVVVTSSGRGYTSAPSVAFASTTGGTGATATASLGSGQFADSVTSVSVGAGGSSYGSGLARAVDANKEPVTKPVLLAANGTVLDNANQAFWIERPVKQFWLDYTALGLLD